LQKDYIRFYVNIAAMLLYVLHKCINKIESKLY